MASFIRVALFGSKNSKPSAFDPAKDITPLTDRVILITGGAGDLGRQTAIELGRFGKPAHIYLADLPRDEAAQEVAIGAVRDTLPADVQAVVKVSFLDLDLGSLDAVQTAAARFRELEGRLDVLVLNAGIMPVKAGLSKDGYEVTFGVNYLGHALFTRLLMPVLVETQTKQADVRVVVVASEGHSMAPKGGIVFGALKTNCDKMSYFRRYGQSKVALIGLTKQLASEYPQLKVVAVHPGRIATGLGKTLQRDSRLIRLISPFTAFVTTSVELGARNHVWAATSSEVVSGYYFVPVGIIDKNTIIEKDASLTGKLKEWTDVELKGRA